MFFNNQIKLSLLTSVPVATYLGYTRVVTEGIVLLFANLRGYRNTLINFDAGFEQRRNGTTLIRVINIYEMFF